MKSHFFIAASILLLPGAALAQSAGCVSSDRGICLAGGAATVSAVSGNVLVESGRVGRAFVGRSLVQGERLIVRRGAATVSLGPSCQLRLAANSVVTLSRANGSTCLSRLTPNTAAAQSGVTTQTPAASQPLVGASTTPVSGGLLGGVSAPVVLGGVGVVGALTAAAVAQGGNNSLETTPVFISQ